MDRGTVTSVPWQTGQKACRESSPPRSREETQERRWRLTAAAHADCAHSFPTRTSRYTKNAQTRNNDLPPSCWYSPNEKKKRHGRRTRIQRLITSPSMPGLTKLLLPNATKRCRDDCLVMPLIAIVRDEPLNFGQPSCKCLVY